MDQKENGIAARYLPPAVTPAAPRRALTPPTAVLSPLTFTPAQRKLQERDPNVPHVGKSGSVAKVAGCVTKVAKVEAPEPLAELVAQLSGGLWLDDVLRDASSCAGMLRDRTDRITSLEKELDSSQAAHEELSQLLQKSMEREREKARRAESQQLELEQWKEKYGKLYEDAKSKISLSAEKIQYYKDQLKVSEAKQQEFVEQARQMETLTNQTSERQREMERKAVEKAQRLVQEEVQKAHAETEQAKRAAMKLRLQLQKLEVAGQARDSELVEVQDALRQAKQECEQWRKKAKDKSPVKSGLAAPRLSSGSSGAGSGRFSLAGFMSP